jgi:hypothetical protein
MKRMPIFVHLHEQNGPMKWYQHDISPNQSEPFWEALMAEVQSTTLELNFAPAESRLIPLRNKKGEVIAHAIVDAEDYDQLNQRRWSLSNGYVCGGIGASGKRRSLRMHREIMNPPADMQVDHINGNRLDNRRSNLRICTQAENNQNRHLFHASSGLRNVYADGDGYYVRFERLVDGKREQVYVGKFRTVEEAGVAAIEARKKYMTHSPENSHKWGKQ